MTFSHHSEVFAKIYTFVDKFQAMDKSPIKKFLIDGFPRNKDNLDGWEREMKDKVDLKAVFVFQVPEEVSTLKPISIEHYYVYKRL